MSRLCRIKTIVLEPELLLGEMHAEILTDVYDGVCLSFLLQNDLIKTLNALCFPEEHFSNLDAFKCIFIA